MLHYIELFVKSPPADFDTLNENWFQPQGVAALKRKEIISLIDQFHNNPLENQNTETPTKKTNQLQITLPPTAQVQISVKEMDTINEILIGAEKKLSETHEKMQTLAAKLDILTSENQKLNETVEQLQQQKSQLESALLSSKASASSSQNHAPNPNTFLENVVIEEQIAKGNFGVIYKGQWANDTVVVKELKSEDERLLQTELAILQYRK
jgi:hypothetical protein